MEIQKEFDEGIAQVQETLRLVEFDTPYFLYSKCAVRFILKVVDCPGLFPRDELKRIKDLFQVLAVAGSRDF
jgi:hypothetical protein